MLRADIKRIYWERCKIEMVEAHKLSSKLTVFDAFGDDLNENNDVHELIIKYYRLMKARINDSKFNP